jgi:hypothetical protein
MTMANDRPDFTSEGAPAIDKTILVNVNRNKYPVVRPTWALKPGLTDRLVVGRNVTLKKNFESVSLGVFGPSVSQSVIQPSGSAVSCGLGVELPSRESAVKQQSSEKSCRVAS